MPVGRSRQGTNQAGALAPLTSAWGQEMAGGTSGLIDQPRPIGWRHHNFGGTVGGCVTISASVLPLFHSRGFFGDVPETQQDTVIAPDPWNRV